MGRKPLPPPPTPSVVIARMSYRSRLTAGKRYMVVSAPRAEVCGLLRVVDDAGMNDLYLASRFLPVPEV